MKIPFIRENEFIIYIEDYCSSLFIHCDVLVPWSKTVKQKLTNSFNKLTETIQQPIHAIHTKEDKKHYKFLKLFNFTYLFTAKGTDNKEYEVYIWR